MGVKEEDRVLEGTRIQLGGNEADAVNKLLAEHGKGSLSRRDPDEQGPVVVKIDGRQWVVENDGTVEEVQRG